jgi:hypothetical protein
VRAESSLAIPWKMWTRERKAGSHTQIWDGSEFSRSQFARMQFSARYSSSQGFTNYRGGQRLAGGPRRGSYRDYGKRMCFLVDLLLLQDEVETSLIGLLGSDLSRTRIVMRQSVGACYVVEGRETERRTQSL